MDVDAAGQRPIDRATTQAWDWAPQSQDQISVTDVAAGLRITLRGERISLDWQGLARRRDAYVDHTQSQRNHSLGRSQSAAGRPSSVFLFVEAA